MILKGRRKITSELSSDDLKTEQNIIDLINNTMVTHEMNKAEIDYLVNYKNGIQPILFKEKTVRPEINNKNVFNHAQMITREVVGYFLGTPIQYIQSDANGKDEIDMLNRFVSYEDKSSVDKEIGEYQSITGTGYRMIYTDGQFKDEVPFEQKALNPSNTYVVYKNDISEVPLVGITYLTIKSPTGDTIGYKFFAYTEFGFYVISSTGYADFIGSDVNISFTPYNVGGVPIVEYPNNMWRIGDWELCIDIMNSINSMYNGRLDDIDQLVQSLIVFINADIDEEIYDEMRASGVVALQNKTQNRSEVKTISSSLDQTGMNLFAQELEELLYAFIGIPSRNNRSGGGGDTGQAVELRDGWANLEIVARNKELSFKRSEKQSLKIFLAIMNNKLNTNLSLLDIDIKFSRNKNNNLLVKTQSLQTLIATKILSPADCLTIVDLVSDVNEYITRGEQFWGDNFANKVEVQNDATLIETVTSDTSTQNVDKIDTSQNVKTL